MNARPSILPTATGLLLDMMGGFTQQVRNPDSWEGWYLGSKHVWGQGIVGMMHPSDNCMKDITENSDMVLFWGCDPETTPWGFVGQFASRLCYFWTECGIKQVYVCPDLNYGAAVHADKWIPILPNTDSALQLAIIYTWIKEGTWDKEYVKTHAVGMKQVTAYVVGDEDGIPKTPEWASEKCGVPEWTIKALARAWANRTTSLVHGNGGPGVRAPYSTEPARLEAMLLGMQGLGRPGVHQAKMIEWWLWSEWYPLPYQGKVRFQLPQDAEAVRPAGGMDPNELMPPLYSGDHPEVREFTRLADYPPFSRSPSASCPMPSSTRPSTGGACARSVDRWGSSSSNTPTRSEGCSEIHMIWTDSPCWITCWNDSNRIGRAFAATLQIECIVAQHPWLENDCHSRRSSSCPVTTRFEMLTTSAIDLGTAAFVSHSSWTSTASTRWASRTRDYETVGARSPRSWACASKYTRGQDRWRRGSKLSASTPPASKGPDHLGGPQGEAGHYVIPCDRSRVGQARDPPGLSELLPTIPRGNHPLTTPTGHLEYYVVSRWHEALPRRSPSARRRPRWIERGPSHDERLKDGDRAKIVSVARASPTIPAGACTPERDDMHLDARRSPPGRIEGPDGYRVPAGLSLHPDDAAASRGIQAPATSSRSCNERGVGPGAAPA